MQVHDELVGQQNADPASDAYYTALESRVQQAFPDRWAAGQTQQHHPPLHHAQDHYSPGKRGSTNSRDRVPTNNHIGAGESGFLVFPAGMIS